MTEFQKKRIEIIEKGLDKIEDAEVVSNIKSLIESYKYEVDDRGNYEEFVGRKIEDLFNRSPRNNEKILDYLTIRCHRYLQSEFMRFIFRCIDRFGSLDDRFTDGRNEYYVNEMRNLKRVCKENEIYL